MYKDNIDLKIKGEILFNEPMSRHTSFKIGGPADILVFPQDEDDIVNTLLYVKNNNIPWCVLGRGTNVLVRDNGIRGIVIKTDKLLNKIKAHRYGGLLEVSAGTLLSKLVRVTQEMGFSGLEFAIGIPGNLGGAVAMNAGVKDKWIGTFVTRVWGVSENGEKKEWKKEELDFEYRKSYFTPLENVNKFSSSDSSNFSCKGDGNSLTRFGPSRNIITKAELILEKDSPQNIKERINQYIEKRKETQPLEYPSAGSIFKNPGNGKFAAWLIDKAGCKGFKVGSIKVSEKHAGFIINLDPPNAKALDVLSLISEIQKRVNEKYGIKLETEIKIIGE